MRSASIWPLIGRTGGAQLRRASPPIAARPGAGGQHDDVGRDLACRRRARRRRRAPPAIEISLTGVCSRMVAPARFGGDAQGGRELAVVDLMVLRAPHRAGELAGEMRLAPARLGGGNPFQRQAELLLEREVMVEPRLVVGGQRDAPACPRCAARRRCRTPSAVRRRRPASAPGCRGRARPAPPRRARPRQQAASIPAAAWLAPPPAVPGRRPSTAAPLRRQPPGDAEADHAGADDGDVGRLRRCVRDWIVNRRLPSLA